MKARPTLFLALLLLPLLAGAGLALGVFSPQDGQQIELPGVFQTIEPFNSYGHVYDGNNIEAMRPRTMGTHGVVSAGHYLATMAGIEALKSGGNAFDAGVTAAMALKVTKMEYAGWTQEEQTPVLRKT